MLDRALDVFWKHGYTGTTTRELENSLILNQSSLYNSFGSKIDFYAAVLDRYEPLVGETLLAPIERSGAGLDHLVEFFDALLVWISKDHQRGCMLLNSMSETCCQFPAIAQRIHRFNRRLKASFESLLARAESDGDLSRGDNAERASLLLALILGLNIAVRAGSPRDEVERLGGAIKHQIACWRQHRQPGRVQE